MSKYIEKIVYIDKIRRAFLWKGRKEAKCGHCLIAWPKVCRSRELGGLGIADLESLGIALKARWPWLKRSAPNKPWANLPIQVSKEVAGLISVAVITEVGSGSNTLFWKDKWLDGKGIQDIAPLVFALVPKRRSNKRTVLEALSEKKWTEDIQGEICMTALNQYLDLWDVMNSVELNENIPDKHIWRLSSSGKYTAKSAYDTLFQGAIFFEPYERI